MNFEVKPDLEEAFAHYGARILKGSQSGWRKALCPLLSHDDTNPSASVNTELGKWRCWVCDKHGDIYDLVGENEHLGLSESVEFCKSNFAPVDGTVRDGGVRTGGVSGGKGNRRKSGTFRPPWSGI